MCLEMSKQGTEEEGRLETYPVGRLGSKFCRALEGTVKTLGFIMR